MHTAFTEAKLCAGENAGRWGGGWCPPDRLKVPLKKKQTRQRRTAGWDGWGSDSVYCCKKKKKNTATPAGASTERGGGSRPQNFRKVRMYVPTFIVNSLHSSAKTPKADLISLALNTNLSVAPPSHRPENLVVVLVLSAVVASEQEAFLC